MRWARWMLLLLFGGISTGGNAENPASVPTSMPAIAATRHTVDIYIDPHGKPLACYQIELTIVGGNGAIFTGIEAGDAAGGFGDAPYFDKRAMKSRRIVFGAFDVAAHLPTGKTRMAILTIQVPVTSGVPQYEAKLQSAASGDGTTIDATISVEQAGL